MPPKRGAGRPIRRTTDVEEEELPEFCDLGLSDSVVHGLRDAGFLRPSPIQAASIPLGRFGIDLIARAKSGTGKTAAFAVVALEGVAAGRGGPQALLVSPTREIALQTAAVCRTIGGHLRSVNVGAFIGGTRMKADEAAVAKCEVACGTPGRLVALLMAEAILGERVRILVLDEADKLAEDDFEPQLRYLLTALPTRKQTLAFSATFPPRLLAALHRSMRAPRQLSLIENGSAVEGAGRDREDDGGSYVGRHLNWDANVDSILDAATSGEVRASAAASSTEDQRLAEGLGNDGDAALIGVCQFYRVVRRANGEADGSHGASSDDGKADDTTVLSCCSEGANGDHVEREIRPLSTHVGTDSRHNRKHCRRHRMKSGETKVSVLLQLLDTLTFHQALIFYNDAERGEKLASTLSAVGFPAAFISGRKEQSERSTIVAKFRAFTLRILVATDLLARGVDFGRVSLVIQLDAPRDVPTYLHRVGRTGRYGTLGASILVLYPPELERLAPILSTHRMQVLPLPHALSEDEYLQRREFNASDSARMRELLEMRGQLRLSTSRVASAMLETSSGKQANVATGARKSARLAGAQGESQDKRSSASQEKHREPLRHTARDMPGKACGNGVRADQGSCERIHAGTTDIRRNTTIRQDTTLGWSSYYPSISIDRPSSSPSHAVRACSDASMPAGWDGDHSRKYGRLAQEHHLDARVGSMPTAEELNAARQRGRLRALEKARERLRRERVAAYPTLHSRA